MTVRVAGRRGAHARVPCCLLADSPAGIDIGTPEGIPIVALKAGMVIRRLAWRAGQSGRDRPVSAASPSPRPMIVARAGVDPQFPSLDVREGRSPTRCRVDPRGGETLLHSVAARHSLDHRPGLRRGRTTGGAIGLAALLLGVILLGIAPSASADEPALDTEDASFEVDFLTMMIDHHQMAVHMSELCVERAVHERLASLCEDIMAEQAAEIEQMQGWLLDWYAVEHEPSMADPEHHMQMEHLETLSGEEFEMAFLEMMIEHHAMAVVDGVECIQRAAHPELRSLCVGIVSSQMREIVKMQVWLCRWYGVCDFRSPLAA